VFSEDFAARLPDLPQFTVYEQRLFKKAQKEPKHIKNRRFIRKIGL
jgi:hypothetical protein